MKIKILDKTKKKKFIEGFSEFGLARIDPKLDTPLGTKDQTGQGNQTGQGMLIRSGEERLRVFSGSLTKDEIMELWRLLPIEGVGLYVAKDFMKKNGIHEMRLSLDALHLWREQLVAGLPGVSGCGDMGVSDKKNSRGRIVELDEKEEAEWFLGNDIQMSELVLQRKIGNFSSDKPVVSSEMKGFVLVKSKASGDFIGTGKISKDGILFNYLPKERRRKLRM